MTAEPFDECCVADADAEQESSGVGLGEGELCGDGGEGVANPRDAATPIATVTRSVAERMMPASVNGSRNSPSPTQIEAMPSRSSSATHART